MSVLKSGPGTGTDVRPAPRPLRFGAAAAHAEDRDPERERLQNLVRDYERQLAAKDQLIGDLERSHEQAVIAAEARGEAKGRQAADDGRQQALARLDQGIEEAMSAYRETLGRLEESAGLVAGAALSRIVGDASQQADLVAQTLRLHMAELNHQSVLAIEVSASDFPDETTLETLAIHVGRPLLRVEANPELASGACRVKLRLGEVELDLASQWARLAAILEPSKGGAS